MTCTVKFVVIMALMVENVNVDPPFDVTSGDTVDPDVTVKSDAIAVVGPNAVAASIVQTIGIPILSEAVLAHERLDAEVGKS